MGSSIADYRRILITGGTGSFGRFYLRELLKNQQVDKVVIFSRDELKQSEIYAELNPVDRLRVRFFLGDVRDLPRLTLAFKEIDLVVHAAALKQVPAAEYNPFEFIKTNIIGAQNVIDAALATGVKSVVALSTDKACAPVNLYGATKLCSDKLFVAANNIAGRAGPVFSVVRYGNVNGSRGSVIPFFKSIVKDRPLPVTDVRMTRFSISLADGVGLVNIAASTSIPGAIYIPKIPSYRILDLVEAFKPRFGYEVVGIRVGEKIHEEMISSSDSANTFDWRNGYVVLPVEVSNDRGFTDRLEGLEPVVDNFEYNSGSNTSFLSVDELARIVNF